MFNEHFGTSPPVLTPQAISAAAENDWASERIVIQGFGRAVKLRSGAVDAPTNQIEGFKTRVRLRDTAIIERN